MGLQWLGKQAGAGLGDLIARRKHARAAALLRAEIASTGNRAPSVRLQLADLLTLAGRGEEALPILIGLADELLSAGFPERAREALERAERIHPDRPGLQQRLQKLRPAPSATAAPAAFAAPPAASTVARETPWDSRPESYPGGEAFKAWVSAETPALPDVPVSEERFESAEPAWAGDAAVAAEPVDEVFDGAPYPATTADPIEIVEEFRRGTPAGGDPTATALFRALSDEEMTTVLPSLFVRSIPDGDVVFSEGEVGDGVFAVASGVVKVWVMNPDGRDFEIAEVAAGGVVGEHAMISGRLRTATISAAGPCTLLEIEKDVLESIARRHASVRCLLQELYVERSTSPEAAAVRAVAIPADAQRRAEDALRDHFGESRWDRRMRLRFADLLAQTGHVEAAVSVLVAVADDLATAGLSRKAVTLFRKIERVRRYEIKELRLAPLARPEELAEIAAGAAAPPSGRLAGSARENSRARSHEDIQAWTSRLFRDTPDHARERERA
jgi:CRP-like cAMP-binding protein